MVYGNGIVVVFFIRPKDIYKDQSSNNSNEKYHFYFYLPNLQTFTFIYTVFINFICVLFI